MAIINQSMLRRSAKQNPNALCRLARSLGCLPVPQGRRETDARYLHRLVEAVENALQADDVREKEEGKTQ